jgi:hypothetical protein
VPAQQGLEGKKNRPLVVDDENAAIFSSHGTATEARSSLSGGEALTERAIDVRMPVFIRPKRK